MKNGFVKAVAMMIVMFFCVAIASESIASDTQVPGSFTQFWTKKLIQLKKRQYESFFQDSLWPQRGGYSSVYESKKAFIKDCKIYWVKDSWKTPKIYMDTDKDINPKDGVVIRVVFEKEDKMFVYVDFDGSYKLTSVFTNLAGGD
jgi:hypothetical protein